MEQSSFLLVNCLRFATHTFHFAKGALEPKANRFDYTPHGFLEANVAMVGNDINRREFSSLWKSSFVGDLTAQRCDAVCANILTKARWRSESCKFAERPVVVLRRHGQACGSKKLAIKKAYSFTITSTKCISRDN